VTHNQSITRPAFTLAELLVALAGTALLIVLAAPAISGLRTDARLAGSVDNLRTLGKANAGYADANEGDISGYDWDFEDGVEDCAFGLCTYTFDIGGGETNTASYRLDIAQLQMSALLRRGTGRYTNPGRIGIDYRKVPHRRYSHLPLLDWFGGSVTDPLAVSPLDIHQQAFQAADILDYEALPGGDPDAVSLPSWWQPGVINRWPFASSYMTTTYAWSESRPCPSTGGLPLEPASNGIELFVIDSDTFSVQPLIHVDFPALKAHMFEEFDYREGLGVNGRFFADPEASVNVLFFDGSARLIPTADTNPGWDPTEPCNQDATTSLAYVPIDTRYFSSAYADTSLPQPYRWTRGGLEGIDVGADEINTSGWCD